MEYEKWKNGELNKPWKELFPVLWEDFVKSKENKVEAVKIVIQNRLRNCELWFKEGEDLSGEIHFLKEILEKVEFIEECFLIG